MITEVKMVQEDGRGNQSFLVKKFDEDSYQLVRKYFVTFHKDSEMTEEEVKELEESD